jgi:hypothetical protein
MPPKENSPDIVRTAQEPGELRAQNYAPSSSRNDRAAVKSVERPRRGHGY